MARKHLVTVVERRDYGCASELVFEVEDDFLPSPGQFVHIACGGDGRILRRPYSVFSHSPGKASVLVREAGAGSSWLRARNPGDRLDMLGPLGRGFDVIPGEMGLLVAGGAGIAPLHFLASRLCELGERFTIAWGMAREGEYGSLPDRVGELGDLRLAFLQGGPRQASTAVELALRLYPSCEGGVCACGPREMVLSLVRGLKGMDEGVLRRLQVSVEERMACGVGACRGCAVPAAGKGEGFMAACSDGPVFRGDELDWERMAALT